MIPPFPNWDNPNVLAIIDSDGSNSLQNFAKDNPTVNLKYPVIASQGVRIACPTSLQLFQAHTIPGPHQQAAAAAPHHPHFADTTLRRAARCARRAARRTRTVGHARPHVGHARMRRKRMRERRKARARGAEASGPCGVEPHGPPVCESVNHLRAHVDRTPPDTRPARSPPPRARPHTHACARGRGQGWRARRGAGARS